MKVILVDDEMLAMARMGKMLSEFAGLEIIGQFFDGRLAIEQIILNQPDVVFLDIEMPEISGLDVAMSIRNAAPHTEVVFVSAQGQYALEAFNIQVMDFILKPVAKHRLRQSIELLGKRKNQSMVQQEAAQAGSSSEIQLKSMGRFQLQQEGEAPVPLKWRTIKIRELFAYLLHNRSQVVSKDTLIQLLWPEVEEQKGIMNLQTSIYRIRQRLKEQGLEEFIAVTYNQFGYILEMNGVLLDSEVWEGWLKQLSPISRFTVSEHQRLFDAYTGDYFGEDNYFWAEIERQRLKAMWLHHAEALADYYLDQGKEVDALSIYYRLVQHDPMLEHGHLAIMHIHDRLQDAKAVEMQYQLMVRTLEQEAGVRPGREVTKWYSDWKGMN